VHPRAAMKVGVATPNATYLLAKATALQFTKLTLAQCIDVT